MVLLPPSFSHVAPSLPLNPGNLKMSDIYNPLVQFCNPLVQICNPLVQFCLFHEVI